MYLCYNSLARARPSNQRWKHGACAMNLHPISTQVTPTLRSEAASDASTRLHGRWRILACAAWASMVVLTLGVFAASLPARYAELRTVVEIAEPATRFDDMLRLRAEDIPAIEQLGLSIDALAAYGIVLAVALVSGSTAVALVIFWHKSDDWMALLVSLVLVTISPFFTFTMDALARAAPIWRLVVSLVLALGFATSLIFGYLFPDG